MPEENLPEKWTGNLVGRMHNEKVRLEDLANEMGVSKGYVSMLLNGQRKPPNAKERLNAAFQAVLDKRKQQKEEPKDGSADA